MSDLLNTLMVEKPDKSTEMLTIRLPKAMHDSIEKLAEKTGRAKAEVVKAMIDKCLKEIEAQL